MSLARRGATGKPAQFNQAAGTGMPITRHASDTLPRQAGSIARAAHAKLVIPFHFSPRYAGREEELRREIEAARAGLA